MPLSDIVLPANNILVTQSSVSGAGIEVQTPGYVFGVVAAVSSVSNGVQTNQSVLFKQKDAVVLKYGSSVYYLLDESNVAFREEIPV